MLPLIKFMADSSQKDLAVIIVTWNVRDAVLENLRSIHASMPKPALDIILIDNASIDGTLDAVREEFPDVRLIENKHNLGFAKACNQGLAASAARHAVLLNPDMRVEPDAFAKTIIYLDAHPEAGVIGPKLIGEDGGALLHIRRFPSLADQLVIIWKMKKFFPSVIAKYMGEDLDLEKEQRVDSVRGAYFAINRTALDTIGALDERYFIWFEEVDYCKHVYEHGLEVRYVPAIVAHDLVGKSFVQRDLRWKQMQFRNSMEAYFDKWHPGFAAFMIHFAWAIIWPFVLLWSV